MVGYSHADIICDYLKEFIKEGGHCSFGSEEICDAQGLSQIWQPQFPPELRSGSEALSDDLSKDMIYCHCVLPEHDVSFQLLLRATETIEDIRRRIYEAYRGAFDTAIDSYILKMGGMSVYFGRENPVHPLHQCREVRDLIIMGKPLLLLVLNGEVNCPTLGHFAALSQMDMEVAQKWRRVAFQIQVLSMWLVGEQTLEECTEPLHINADIYHGGKLLANGICSNQWGGKAFVPRLSAGQQWKRWNLLIAFPVQEKDIPHESIIYLRVKCSNDSHPACWATYPISSVIIAATKSVYYKHVIRLWSGQAQTGFYAHNKDRYTPGVLCLEHKPWNKEVDMPPFLTEEPGDVMQRFMEAAPSTLAAEDWTAIQGLLKSEYASVISKEERICLWTHWNHLKTDARALPRFLAHVQWHNPTESRITHRLLCEWSTPSPLSASQLLGPLFPDVVVRARAVHELQKLDTKALASHMFQLVQVKHRAQ